MATTNQTIYVGWTAPNGTRPDIGFFTNQACTSPWPPNTMAYGDIVSYKLLRGNGSDFDFSAITFWARDERGIVSQVARSFQKSKNDTASFDGDTYLSDIDTNSKKEITFTATNNNNNGQIGYFSFQVTIKDTSSKPNLLYTSVDPQVELEAEPG